MTADYLNSPTVRVSLIIINERREILLAKHKKQNREYWVLPGGHLDFGETVEQCALRELREETNLIGEFERVVFSSESIDPSGRRHIINFYVLVTVPPGQSIQVGSDEDILTEVCYKPLDELTQYTVYPNISNHIIQNHNQNWSVPNIQWLDTPWT